MRYHQALDALRVKKNLFEPWGEDRTTKHGYRHLHVFKLSLDVALGICYQRLVQPGKQRVGYSCGVFQGYTFFYFIMCIIYGPRMIIGPPWLVLGQFSSMTLLRSLNNSSTIWWVLSGLLLKLEKVYVLISGFGRFYRRKYF